MTMRPHETQRSISTWAATRSSEVASSGRQLATRVLEEAVELCLEAGIDGVHVMETVREGIFAHLRGLVPGFDGLTPGDKGRFWAQPTPNPVKVPAKAADVMIVSYALADASGFDLHAEVDRAMAAYRTIPPDGEDAA